MDKFDRIYKLHQVFSSRRYPVALADIRHELDNCSTATAKRLIREMRDYLNAPVVNLRGRGYCYDKSREFELPGLWFNRRELEALLALNQLLSHVGPGLLDEYLVPVRKRLERLLAKMSPAAASEIGRIRILGMSHRRASLPHFPLVAAAVLERIRLGFVYDARSSNVSERRVVSPQRLVHYRDNWYLDAFCHKRSALRTFSLDRMTKVIRGNVAAHEISEDELNSKLGSAYGIFAGGADKLAILRFTPKRARWIADEQWHPEQQEEWLADGRYELRIPYADDTELILDICRYGPDVEVADPAMLKIRVTERLKAAAAQYQTSGITK